MKWPSNMASEISPSEAANISKEIPYSIPNPSCWRVRKSSSIVPFNKDLNQIRINTLSSSQFLTPFSLLFPMIPGKCATIETQCHRLQLLHFCQLIYQKTTLSVAIKNILFFVLEKIYCRTWKLFGLYYYVTKTLPKSPN